MSSSFRLKKRMETPGYYMENLGATPFNHYVSPFLECHPDFVAHSIGSPDGGVKICVRKENSTHDNTPDNRSRQLSMKMNTLKTPEVLPKRPTNDEMQEATTFGGTNPVGTRKTRNLYDPFADPYQLNSPYTYDQRRYGNLPDESYLLRNNLLVKPINYDGIGFSDAQSPDKTADYGYDFLPQPPPLYDVTQLHNRYLLWQKHASRRRANGVQSDTVAQNDILYIPFSP